MTDHNITINEKSIPHSVWPPDALRQAERCAANDLGLSLYELMLRAGEAAFNFAREQYPASIHWLVLCGCGNNGGDGYVLARLAQAAGIRVTLLAQQGEKTLPEEAGLARQAWLNAGGIIHAENIAWPEDISLIIDALVGTGLKSAPRKAVASLINQCNRYPAPVVALDIPSGLQASSGAVSGEVVNANFTLAFIALKPGLLTGKARDVVGELHCHALGLEHWLAARPLLISRFDSTQLSHWLKPRRPTSHKGDNGRLLLIGGDTGTAGAIRMAGEAALRSGAGLVRVLTREAHIAPLLTARPELMVNVLTPDMLDAGIEWADVVVIGPGLGQQSWGKEALQKVQKSLKPMLWDADALNLLAMKPDKRHNRILTPHPGEAARLLHCSVSQIENDRFAALEDLIKRYGGCVILKGAGTLVGDWQGARAIIDTGNAGMGSGGMGDVLSGIIGALLAQKLNLYDAASAGSVIHGAAADCLSRRYGTRGWLASDLFSALYPFVNPDVTTINHDESSYRTT